MSPLQRVLPDLLARKGMSQREFARRVGLTASAINKIVHGKAVPRPKRAAAWCAALGLDAAQAKLLIDAIHLAAATEHVQKKIEELERKVARLKRRSK